MAIELKSLRWNNMFSYGTNNYIDLNVNKVTQLSAGNGCLSGDSIIIDASGHPYTIKEIVDNKLELEVIGVDSNNKHIKTKILDWFEHEPKQLFKVQLDNGNIITITDSHLLKTMEGWKPLKELKVDDWIVDSRNREYTFNKSNKSDDWWELITYLLTEGGLSDYKNKITFTNNDEHILSKFESKLKSINERLKTTTVGGRQKHRSILFDQDSELKREFIESVCIPEIRGYSYKKHFPKEIFSVSDDTLDKIFAVYLETVGSVENRDIISFSTSSIKMGYQLLHLLRYKYGLQCSSRIKKTTHRDNMEILITRLDYCKKFIVRLLPYLVGHKKEKIESLLNKDSSSSSYTQDLIPVRFLKGLRPTKTNNNPYNNTESRKAYISFKNTKHGINRKNYEILLNNNYVSELESYKNTRYLRIKKIESLKIEPVYDIQTTAGNFIVGDTLVHNSGKTSISLILQELLYNKNVKGLKKADILNKYNNAKSWDATIQFTVDEDEYELSSKRQGASTKVVLLKNGEDISEHKVLDTYKKVTNIIGRDFETFSQLTYQSSTNVLEFLKATDTNRKKFLINLFNLTKYLEIGEQIKLLLGQKEKALSEKTGELKTITEFLNQNSVPETLSEKLLPEVDNSLYPEIDSLTAQLATQKSLCTKIDSNNLYIQERDKLNFDVSLAAPTLDDSVLTKIDSLKSNIQDYKTQIAKLKKDINSLDTSDRCYACKQPIDNSKAKELSESLTQEIAQKQKLLGNYLSSLEKLLEVKNTYDKDMLAFQHNQKAIERFTQLAQLIDSTLPNSYPNYDEIAKKLKDLKDTVQSQETSLEEAKRHNESVRIRNAKIDALKEQIRNFKARQELVKNDILNIQNEIANLTILKKAFSTSGIVAYKLENVAKQLEESINYYLSMLSDGQFQVVFRLTGDKLNIVVINEGKEVSIDSLSGGEFSRVQTSVLLAVRNTLSNIGGKSINLLFLDEVMAVLDDAGKEGLIDVLQREKGLNVFLISHEYKHPLIPVIEISKKEKISKLNIN